LIGTLVERRPDKLKRIRTENHSFPTDYLFFTFRTFGLIPKVPKDQGFPKMAENRRAFWLEETKVVTIFLYLRPMYKITCASPTFFTHVSSLFICCLFS